MCLENTSLSSAYIIQQPWPCVTAVFLLNWIFMRDVHAVHWYDSVCSVFNGHLTVKFDVTGRMKLKNLFSAEVSGSHLPLEAVHLL